MTLCVQLIGSTNRAEMRPIVAWLKLRTTANTLQRSATVAEFLEHRRDDWHPDLIVALESHPDEYSPGDLTALVSVAPIGRILCCAGAWSESAGRTRKDWPTALRVAAVSAIPRLEEEWRQLTNASSRAPLPPTGTREEWFASQHPPISLKSDRSAKRVRVVSPDPGYRNMLVELLREAGEAASLHNEAAFDVLLWDIDPWSPARTEELQRHVGEAFSTPVIALSNWVTPELEAEFVRAGVLVVLPKLGDLGRLCEIIRNIAVS